MARATTAGQRHDSLAFEPLMRRLKVVGTGPGRPRIGPDRLLGDKAYSNRKIGAHLHRRGIKATVREKTDQQKARIAKGSAGGRPPACDAESYKQRNTVECTINTLKDSRAVAMRTDEREFVYQGTIDVAAIKIWLRHPHQPRSARHALADALAEACPHAECSVAPSSTRQPSYRRAGL
jgi:transposase